MTTAKKTKVTMIPGLRYHDAAAAIEWLGRAFGFEKHLVVPGDRGGIVHAELVFGNGMIMLGTAGPDAHYQRAVAAGAEITLPIEDKGHGGRGYTCRDLEGHVWSFGSYVPWPRAE